MTNADKYFRNATEEEIAEVVTMAQVKAVQAIFKDLGLNGKTVTEESIEKTKTEWFDWLKQEVSDNG